MACDLSRLATIQQEKRREQIKLALARIEAGLSRGTIRVRVGPQGSIALPGLTDEARDGLTDACIYRHLQARQSPALRAALARAEAAAGRAHDPRAILAGHHSHDGGKTWGPGHSH